MRLSMTMRPTPAWMASQPRAPRLAAKGRASGASWNTAAPAPSPNKTQVERSAGSSRRLRASQPTTRAYWPPRVISRPRAAAAAYTKPEQAALTSRVGIFSRRASAACTRQATLGAASGAERVAQMHQPISAGDRPLRSSACFAAEMARVEADSSGAHQCRVRMPVRLTIHSSLVSTVRLRSSLVTVRLGSAPPVAISCKPSMLPSFLRSDGIFCNAALPGLCRPSGPVQPAGGAAQGRCFGTMLGGHAAHPPKARGSLHLRCRRQPGPVQ